MNTGKLNGFRWLLVIALVLGLSLSVVHPVQAADFDDDGRVEAGETIDDDVFLGNDQVVVDGTVNGLVFAAGRTITIHGVINGDLIATAEEITLGEDARVTGNIFAGARLIDLRGQVGGSFFAGAADIRLADRVEVGRNAFFGGYSVNAASGSKIDRDLYAGAYQAQLNGQIGRNAVVDAAAVEVNGAIGGNAQLRVEGNDSGPMWTAPFSGYQLPEPLTPGLRVAPGATIGGKLTYTSRSDYSAQIQAQPAGGLVYQTPVPGESGRDRTPTVRTSPFLDGSIKALRNLITLLILGALALWLIPAAFKKVVAQAQARPLPSVGAGFLSIIVAYAGGLLVAGLLLGVGILLSLITLGGLSNMVFGIGFSTLGLAMAVFTFLLATGSKLIASYLVGDLIFERLAPQAQGRRVWPLVVGVLIYVILAALPFVGWVFAWIATFLGLGAIWFAWQKRQPAAAETAAN